MEEKLLSTLSVAEQNELSMGLLREWLIKTIDAFVDSAGPEVALRSLKPYFDHAGKASAHFLPDIIGILPKDARSIAILEWTPQICINQVTPIAYLGKKDNAYNEVSNCPTRGASKEACVCQCKYAAATMAQELNQEYVMDLTSSLGLGDQICRWEVRKKTAAPTNFQGTEQSIEVLVPDEGMRHQLGLQYRGEMWVLATRAFLDHAGPTVIMERLGPYLRESGLSIGAQLHNAKEPQRSVIISIGNIIGMLNEVHHKDGTIESSKDDQITGFINSCPFSSSPPEICLQYQAFFNGVCEAIGPEYEFIYDRMMTKGDKTCQWVIKKKQVMEGTKTAEHKFSDDPVKMLTMMYVKGEITEDEFRKKLAVLKELRL